MKQNINKSLSLSALRSLRDFMIFLSSHSSPVRSPSFLCNLRGGRTEEFAVFVAPEITESPLLIASVLCREQTEHL